MRNLKGLLLSSIVLLSIPSGCTSSGEVRLRPDGSPGPQECPAEAKKAMHALNLRVGDAAELYMDVNQTGDFRRIILHDGPIVSVLSQGLGSLAKTSLLYGRVWTGGPQVVIRYYEAKTPDGEKVPLCAIAQLADDYMWKLPESKPGAANLDDSTAIAIIVDAFR